MRSRVIVIGRDAEMRASLVRLAARAGYRADVAESFAHARRTGLDEVALEVGVCSKTNPQAAVPPTGVDRMQSQRTLSRQALRALSRVI